MYPIFLIDGQRVCAQTATLPSCQTHCLSCINALPCGFLVDSVAAIIPCFMSRSPISAFIADLGLSDTWTVRSFAQFADTKAFSLPPNQKVCALAFSFDCLLTSNAGSVGASAKQS